VIKELLKLDKNIKKNDPPQNRTQTKEKQKDIRFISLGLFTFVVLLSTNVGVAIFLFCSKKWLLAYVSSC
jgi:hypothetical protein